MAGEPSPPDAPKVGIREGGQWPWLLLWLLLVALVLSISSRLVPSETSSTLSYTAFLDKVDAGEVRKVSIDSNGAMSGTLADGSTFKSQIPALLAGEQLQQRLRDKGVDVTGKGPSTSWLSVVLTLLPVFLLIGFFLWMARRTRGLGAGGVGGFGQSKTHIIDEQRPDVRFADVAGYSGAKQELSEVVDFLKNPAKYKRLGAKGPRGVLMLGPPGSGKTLMARAIAGEADVPFLTVTGSAFVELFVGVGAARVRDLFQQARKLAPAIIFIDEIDAVGQRRGGNTAVSNDEREQTVNQLLAEMDGFDPAEGIVVLAATNRPDVLDPALLRPGRFDRRVVIPLPNRDERESILGVHCRNKPLGPDVRLDELARATPGFSGADLANLANEAAINAVRAGRDAIVAADFDEARDRVLLGRREGSSMLLPDEKRAVAVHESGHALVAALSAGADPVAKVTILPSGPALGATEQLPLDDRHLYSETYLHTSLAVRLGGRAAERVVLGEVSSGAADDLAGATEIATRMVSELGMSDEIGPVGYGTTSPYLGYRTSMHEYADATQRAIDLEVARVVREAEERACEMLAKHRGELDRLTARLLEEETVNGAEVYRLLGVPVPQSAVGTA